MELVNLITKDGVKLNGFLHKSNTDTKDIVLSVHGMASNCLRTKEQRISEKVNQNGMDYYCFNNRGSEIARYAKRILNGKKEILLLGTAFEDPLDSYLDIVAAILKLKELGYENIYLQGHSLGCTKILYTYNRLKEEKSELLNNIKGIILLSLIDINRVTKYVDEEKYKYYLNWAEEKEKQGELLGLMPSEAFIHRMSVKTYLRYMRDYQEIDADDYNIVKKVEVPLFMRWGTINEAIIYKPDELVEMVKNKIPHEKKDIGYIDGANHSYNEYEYELADQIIAFIKKYQ